jgi:integrase
MPARSRSLRTWRKKQIAGRLAWGTDCVENGLVFTRENGEALHPDMLTDTFERLSFAAGLPPVQLHRLRHSHATYELSAGVDIGVVQERLGHSTRKLTGTPTPRSSTNWPGGRPTRSRRRSPASRKGR